MKIKQTLQVLMMVVVFQATKGRAYGEPPTERLDPAVVFTVEEPEAMWREIYKALEGGSVDEKSRHAVTTLDLLALSRMELYRKEKALSEIGMELYKFLPERVSDRVEHPRETFLKTHRVWRKYVKLQSEFIADTSGGGTAYPLYFRATTMAEIDWRISLYKEMLAGENVVKHSLYFYDYEPGKEF